MLIQTKIQIDANDYDFFKMAFKDLKYKSLCEYIRSAFHCKVVEDRLDSKSVVDCFQIRALSHQRFLRKIGGISERDIDLVKQAIALILDMEPKHCV